MPRFKLEVSCMVQLLKLISLAVLILLAISPALAQETKLQLEFRGYGKSYQEIYLTVKNTGTQTLSDITFYVDGYAYETISGTTSPGSTFVESFYLQPGKHLIEARGPEGAYASLEVEAKAGAPSETTLPTVSRKEETKPYEINFPLLLAGIIIIVIILIAWLGKRR
jgi:hypothetical protein